MTAAKRHRPAPRLFLREYPGWGSDLEGLVAQRPGETAVVVLEPTAGSDR